jgi:hypothetical protein
VPVPGGLGGPTAVPVPGGLGASPVVPVLVPSGLGARPVDEGATPVPSGRGARPVEDDRPVGGTALGGGARAARMAAW